MFFPSVFFYWMNPYAVIYHENVIRAATTVVVQYFLFAAVLYEIWQCQYLVETKDAAVGWVFFVVVGFWVCFFFSSGAFLKCS